MRTLPTNPLRKIHRFPGETRGPRRAFLRRAFLRRAVPTAALAALPVLAACAVSQQKEVQMGSNYSSQIARQLPLINDPEALRYINVLGDSLATVTDQRDLQWHFNIVDSKEVNAFAVPGGYVYVNRGLIERAETMSQVAGVIGHEIGHVTRRHSIKQMQKAQGANLGMSLGCILTRICGSELAATAIDIGAGGLFAHFSQSDEAEADQEGVRTTIKAGIDPNGIPEMFRILLDERKNSPGAVSAFFATHPLEEDRIAATRALIGTFPPRGLEGLTRDSQNFHAFKERLASLPPSPDRRTQR
jgi:predicted Zn-dependent protease